MFLISPRRTETVLSRHVIVIQPETKDQRNVATNLEKRKDK